MLVAAALSAMALITPGCSRLLVVGGSGYLGREVCRSAVKSGWSVTSLSRRGTNPEPESEELSQVTWLSGDAADEALLTALCECSDAYVHSCAMLFDSESGLAQYNTITSGSGSETAEGATYDTAIVGTALPLLAAAQATGGGPFLFVSAIGAAGAGAELFGKAAPNFFLSRYLAAKTSVEEAMVRYRERFEAAPSARGALLPLVIRPAPMWSTDKYDVLPLMPAWNAAAALPFSPVEPMLPVAQVGQACTSALEVAAAATASDASSPPPLILDAAALREYTPLQSLKPVGPLDTVSSGLASIARLPYGTDVADAIIQGGEPGGGTGSSLVLYEFEACPFCRRVREMATYLDLELTIKPCGRGSRHREEVVAQSGRSSPTFPYLVDESAGVALFESEDICNHLLQTYGAPKGVTEPPPPILGAIDFFASTTVSGWVPSLFRFGRGAAIEPRMAGRPAPAKPLVLYSYEGNQFCRLVREALCELDLPYVLKSTGKGSPRRAELSEVRDDGKTTAPYLVDANQGVKMGESADIVAYLWAQYGQA